MTDTTTPGRSGGTNGTVRDRLAGYRENAVSQVADRPLRALRSLRPAANTAARRALGVALGLQLTVATAMAQSGDSVCGTAIADGMTQTSRLITGFLVIGCIVVAGAAEGYSRIQRDPHATADTKKWRNGAAIGTISVPVVMWFVIQVAGFFQIPVVQCVDLIPYL